MVRTTRRSFLSQLVVASGLGTIAGSPFAFAREERVARDGGEASVVAQRELGDLACGPCCVYNSLIAGDRRRRAALRKLPGRTAVDKVRTLIERHGGAPSETYAGHRPRYGEKTGLTAEDMPHLANDFFEAAGLPKVSGQRLTRKGGEADPRFLERVHRLLDRSSFKPMLSVRSFGAETTGKPVWNGLCGHWLSVRSIGKPLGSPAVAFVLECADSWTGRVIPVFVHSELHRPFTSTSGFTVDDKGREQWRWQRDRPYLLLTVPDLSLSTQKQDWYERTYIALSYAVVSA